MLLILSFPLHLPLFQNFNVRFFPERHTKLNLSVQMLHKQNFKVCFPSSFTVQWIGEYLQCMALYTHAAEMFWRNTWLAFVWIVLLFIFSGWGICCHLKEIRENGSCVLRNTHSYLCNQALSVICKNDKLKVTL